jgi:hypothetical protein
MQARVFYQARIKSFCLGLLLACCSSPNSPVFGVFGESVLEPAIPRQVAYIFENIAWLTQRGTLQEFAPILLPDQDPLEGNHLKPSTPLTKG